MTNIRYASELINIKLINWNWSHPTRRESTRTRYATTRVMLQVVGSRFGIFKKYFFLKIETLNFFSKSGETWIPGEHYHHVRRPSSRSLPWNYWSVIDNENDWGDVRFAIEVTLILLILNILRTCDLLSKRNWRNFRQIAMSGRQSFPLFKNQSPPLMQIRCWS